MSCIAGAVVWQAWSTTAPQHSEARWLRVEPQPLESHLGLVGRIQPARQITVVAPFEGVIATLPVVEGQRVDAGQALITLDTTQIDIQLRQAETERLKAREVFRQLQDWQAGPEMAQARRAQFAARAALASSQSALDDTRRLYERGIVPRMEVDSLDQQVQAQRQSLKDAEQALRLTQARGEGDARRIAQMELANAQARWQALQVLRELQALKAPFAALVMRAASADASPRRQLQVGQQVTQGMPLLALVDLDRLQVLAGVEERDLGKLHVGMEAEVAVAGQRLAGRVHHIALQARNDDGRGSWYDVVVDLDTPSNPLALGLRLGMSAQLTVIVHRSERGIAVPADVLRTDEAGRPYVMFRAQGNPSVRKVPVTVGVAVLQGVEVEGLDVGYVQMP